MNRKRTGLPRAYQAALRKCLEQGPRASLRPAQGLGRQGMALGLETLDLARIHEQALVTLVLPSCSPGARDSLVRRAGAFFAEAIIPIENTHRTARETNVRLSQACDTLRRRSVALAASNRQLKQEIAQRRSVEDSLRKSERHYGRLLEQSRHMQEQLRLLSHQLLLAQEAERKKISRELHDVVAQTLTGINVCLATLKKEAALDTKGIERNIARTQRLVERSVNVVHRFARELRPAVLDDLGLIPALRTFLTRFGKETGIRVSLSAFAAVEQVNEEKRTVLYRVAQEALANVARHAQAGRAEVKIQKLDDALWMEIKDNGKGFQAEHMLHGKRKGRLGLLGMRERLEMVGGHFTVTSAPGKGATVLAQIPLLDRPSGKGKPPGSRSREQE
ncbi:MAG: sensor histidine kinase [Limisphaerales bacterium]